MSEQWMDIFERSGDANLGQTLLRLAGLAEAAHRHQAAMALLERANKAQRGADGIGPGPVDELARMDAGPAHTEVGS